MSKMLAVNLYTDSSRTEMRKYYLTTPTPYILDLFTESGYYESTPVDDGVDTTNRARAALGTIAEALKSKCTEEVDELASLIAGIRVQVGADGRATRRLSAMLAAFLTASEPEGPNGQPVRTWSRKQAADLMPFDMSEVEDVIGQLMLDARNPAEESGEPEAAQDAAETTTPASGTPRRSGARGRSKTTDTTT